MGAVLFFLEKHGMPMAISVLVSGCAYFLTLLAVREIKGDEVRSVWRVIRGLELVGREG